MGTEIERKFLVRDHSIIKPPADGRNLRQGYLSTDPACIVRVRTVDACGFLTVKGLTTGFGRPEFEYEIPVEDAAAMLAKLCRKPLIEKKRYTIEAQGLFWEIDEFFGENRGLILAEVELDQEARRFDKPDWIGEEVSGDPKYYNSNLAIVPYKNWPENKLCG